MRWATEPRNRRPKHNRTDNKSGETAGSVRDRKLPRSPPRPRLQTQPAPSVWPIRLVAGSRHTEQARRSFQRVGPSHGPPFAQPREITRCAADCLHKMPNCEDRSQWTDSILDRSPTTRPAPTLGGSEALHIGSEVASALGAARGQRVLHRGLMPRRERHRFFSLESLSLGKLGRRARGGQSRASTCTALPVAA